MAKKYNYTYGHGGETEAISLSDQMREAKQIIGAKRWDSLSEQEKKERTDYMVMKGEIEGEDTGPEYDSAGFTEEDRVVEGQYMTYKMENGGKMVMGGRADVFYEGQSVIYPMTNNTKLDKSVREKHNKYANKELVIEEIMDEGGKYKIAKVFDRNSGEKVPFDLVLNPKYLEQYADGGMMAKGGKIKDYDRQPLPKKVFLNGKEFNGEVVVINGYNGYTSTPDDGLLSAIVGNSAFDIKNKKPYLLKDEDGFYIMKKGARGNYFMMADGGMMAKGGTTDYSRLVLKYDYPKYKSRPQFTQYYTIDLSKVVKVGGVGEKGYGLNFKENGNPSNLVITEREIEKLMDGNKIESSGANVTISKQYADGGMMAKGGELKEGDYVWNALGKKLIVDKVTKDEYYLVSFGQSSASPFGKQKVNDYLKKGEWTLKPKMADGGMMAKGGKPKDLPVIHTQFEEEEFEYADGGMMARGGYVSKGEMVWRKLNSSERLDFLYKNFTPQITPRSQEILRGKDYNFLPKNVKNVIESKYANVEDYAHGGSINRSDDVTLRKSPSISATVFPVGVKRLGNDNNIWEIVEDKRGVHRWRITRDTFGHGGAPGRHRKQTLEEKAMESVGSSTWFQLDRETQAGVVAELLSIGALPQRGGREEMAKGAKVKGGDFTVTYELLDGNKVVEKYGTEQEMDEGIANFYIMNDVKDAIVGGVKEPEVVEVKEEVKKEDKPKRKSLFDTEKAAPKVSKSKETAPIVNIKGLEKEIQRYDELKATIKNAEAEKEIIGGLIKDIAKEKYLEVYEKLHTRPTTIILESGGAEISYTVTDKYKGIETGSYRETVLKEYDNLLGTDFTFTFDNEILDTEGKNGEKIGDIVDDLIHNSEDIPDELKDKLVKITKKIGVKKGTIKRLLDYENPAEILEIIEAVVTLK